MFRQFRARSYESQCRTTHNWFFKLTTTIKTHKYFHNIVIMIDSNSKLFSTFINTLNNWLESFKKFNVVSSKFANRIKHRETRHFFDYKSFFKRATKIKTFNIRFTQHKQMKINQSQIFASIISFVESSNDEFEKNLKIFENEFHIATNDLSIKESIQFIESIFQNLFQNFFRVFFIIFKRNKAKIIWVKRYFITFFDFERQHKRHRCNYCSLKNWQYDTKTRDIKEHLKKKHNIDVINKNEIKQIIYHVNIAFAINCQLELNKNRL